MKSLLYHIILAVMLLPQCITAQCWEPILDFYALYQPLENIQQIHFINDSTGWVHGECGTLLKTTDGGESWQQLPNMPTPTIENFFFLDENLGWATAGRFIYRTTNGGLSWQQVIIPNNELSVGTSQIQFINPQTGWTMLGQGQIWRSDNSGLNWYQQLDIGTDDYAGFRFFSMYFTDALHGWILANYCNIPIYYCGSNKIIYRTQDGGQSWEEIYMTEEYLQGQIFFRNDSLGWIGSYSGTCRTSDGGNTWAFTEIPFTYNLDTFINSIDVIDVEFINDTLGMTALSSGYAINPYNGQSEVGFLVSTDGGQSWKRQFPLGPYFSINDDVDMTSDSVAYYSSGLVLFRYRGRPAQCSSVLEVEGAQGLLPLLEWEQASGCFDGYYLQLGTSPGGEEVLPRTDTGFDPFFQVTELLPEAATLYATITPYNHVYGAASGCQSVAFETIQCQPTGSVVDTGFCKGQSLLWRDSLYDSPAVLYEHTLTPLGCDSTVQVNIVQYEDPVTVLQAFFCPGDTYTWGDSLLNQPGDYSLDYVSYRGCDSTAILQLAHWPQQSTDIDTAVCSGDALLWGDSLLLQPGQYQFTYSDQQGCDSLVQVQLSHQPEYLIQVDTFFCAGEVFEWQDQVFTQPGGYNFFEQTAAGCDSITILLLSRVQPVSASLDTFYCEGEGLQWGDTWLSEPGQYSFAYTSVQGCDSTLLLQVSEAMNAYSEEMVVLQPGEPYQGQVYEQDTLLQWVYPAANGCDSLVQVQIDVLSSTNEAEVAGWRAWPNPTNGSWWVSAPSEVLLWRAWDAQGRALALPLPEGSIGQNGGQYRFDLSPLPSGIYFVAALTQQGWWTGRVVRW